MKYLFSFFLLFLSFCALAQEENGASVIIKNILVEGNKHTKKHVILKELDFSVGDKIYTKDLAMVKDVNEKRLLSTALFTGVYFNISNWTNDGIDIKIQVRENWYWYPSPILEVGDRNLNVWLFEENMSLKRTNIGVSLKNFNLTGNADILKIKAQRGFNDKIEAHYNYPYLGKKLGLRGHVFYGGNDEIGYITKGNKLIFGTDADRNRMLTRRRMSLGMTYRESVKSRHKVDVYYRHHNTPDFVTDSLTTNYFGGGQNQLKWASISYKWQYDNRIFNFYPEGGWETSIEIIRDGLGIFSNLNIFTIKLDYQHYLKHNNQYTSGIRLAAGAKFNDGELPYKFNQALGYRDDLIRGYELYVVDGNRWVFGKYSLRHKIYSKELSLGNTMRIKKFKQMPVSVYLRANVEAGYVYDPHFAEDNPINDGVLVGGGPAVDFILYYTFMTSFEYNFNRKGESGIFLKSTFNF